MRETGIREYRLSVNFHATEIVAIGETEMQMEISILCTLERASVWPCAPLTQSAGHSAEQRPSYLLPDRHVRGTRTPVLFRTAIMRAI